MLTWFIWNIPHFVCSIIFGYFIHVVIHAFQIEYFVLRSPISGISFERNIKVYFTNLVIFVLLLYFYIDHIDPYFISLTVQNLNKDNLRTYIIGCNCSRTISRSFSYLRIIANLYVFWSVAFNFHFFSLWFFNLQEFLIILDKIKYKKNYHGLHGNSTSYYPLSFCTLWDSLFVYMFVIICAYIQIAINLNLSQRERNCLPSLGARPERERERERLGERYR